MFLPITVTLDVVRRGTKTRVEGKKFNNNCICSIQDGAT